MLKKEWKKKKINSYTLKKINLNLVLVRIEAGRELFSGDRIYSYFSLV